MDWPRSHSLVKTSLLTYFPQPFHVIYPAQFSSRKNLLSPKHKVHEKCPLEPALLGLGILDLPSCRAQ